MPRVGITRLAPTIRGLRHVLFAGAASLCTVVLVLIALETGLRWRLDLLGLERLAYLPESFKLGLGERYRTAYKRAARAYFVRAGEGDSPDVFYQDPVYGVRPGPPGEPQPVSSTRPFATDVLGFRNAGVPDRADLFFVGDSFTAGTTLKLGLPTEALFTERVGAHLSLRVYQAACSGWGPRQYALAIREFGPRLRPGWVVICTYYENDPFDVWQYDRWKASPFPTYGEYLMYRQLDLPINPRATRLDAHSVLVNVVRYGVGQRATRADWDTYPRVADPERYRTLPLVPAAETPAWPPALVPHIRVVAERPGKWVRIALQTPTAARTFTLAWAPQDGRRSAKREMQAPWWPSYADAMAEAVAAARAAHARPLIVLIPSRERVFAPAALAARLDAQWPAKAALVPDGPARAVASFAAALDTDFLDLAPVLRAALADGVFAYAETDIHWDATGHALAAEAIAAKIWELSGAGPALDVPGPREQAQRNLAPSR